MPKSVDELAANADKLHRELYPEQYGDTPPLEPPIVDDTPPTPPATPPALPDPSTPPEPDAPPVVPVTPEPPAAPLTPPEPPRPDVNEERYKALKGKYDAELPRLYQEIGELKGKLSQMVTSQPTPPTVTAPPDDSSKLIDEFTETYPEIAPGVLAIIKTETNRVRQEAAHEIETIRSQSNFSTQQAFIGEIDRRIPEWRTIRDNPEFVAWLGNADSFSGRTLADLALDAAQQMDTNRVVAFYEGFKKSQQPQEPPAVVPPTPAPPNLAPAPAVDPAAGLVAPPRSAGNAPPVPPTDNSQPITATFISKFYTEAATGKYKGRDAEYNKIEALINKAISTGKVIG